MQCKYLQVGIDCHTPRALEIFRKKNASPEGKTVPQSISKTLNEVYFRREIEATACNKRQTIINNITDCILCLLSHWPRSLRVFHKLLVLVDKHAAMMKKKDQFDQPARPTKRPPLCRKGQTKTKQKLIASAFRLSCDFCFPFFVSFRYVSQFLKQWKTNFSYVLHTKS